LQDTTTNSRNRLPLESVMLMLVRELKLMGFVAALAAWRLSLDTPGR